MIRLLLIMVLILARVDNLFPQRYSVQEGYVEFFSDATLEDIEAGNRDIQSLFNTSTGEIAFRIDIDKFKFRKKLMQEHFNEKYMESDKYPAATFSGVLQGFSPDQSGWQNVTATGDLKIHGVTRTVEVPGKVNIVNAKTIEMKSEFIVRLEDYKVDIPQILWQNIAEQVKVTIQLKYKPN